MGVGGCFRDLKHKSNMYTFVQQRGGCPYFILNHKSINGTFVHTFHNKIMKNYEKMPNFHSFYTNFYIFSMNYYYKNNNTYSIIIILHI